MAAILPFLNLDSFALRKIHTGARWTFVEDRNHLSTASHCDIAWAGALATHAHTHNKSGIGAAIITEDGTVISSDDPHAQEKYLLHTNDPRIWQRWI